MTTHKDFKKSHQPAVLISDDSDLSKNGMKMESFGYGEDGEHQICYLGVSLC